MTSEYDARAAHEASGGDGRQWVAFGTVRPDTPNQRSVLFKDDSGNPLPWPTVLVELHPNGDVVSCRVANSCAGEGEGEWYPFVAGDEVIVVVPEGNERAGCTIIGRLNQTKDVWPAQVGGQDATTNTFGFKRMRAPYILESATALLFRQATTNSFVSIDKTGNVTITEGSDNGFMHVGSDFIGMQTGDNSTLVQLDPTKKQVLLQADTMQMIMDAAKAQIMTKGSLSIATGGAAASGHAVTVEQVISLLFGITQALGAFIYPTPLTPLQITTAVNAGILTASSAPIASFQAALTLALQKPPDDSGAIPGVGRAALKI